MEGKILQTISLKEAQELARGESALYELVEAKFQNNGPKRLHLRYVVKRLSDNKYFSFFYDGYRLNSTLTEKEEVIRTLFTEVFPEEKKITVYT